MKIRFITMLLSAAIPGVQAQQDFVQHGIIKYERTVNAFRLTEGSWMHRNYETNRILKDTFTMVFNQKRSLYYNASYQEDEDINSTRFWSSNVSPSKSNVVYKSLSGDSVWAIRDLFEERFVIIDSMRKPAWKFTGETRDIAGFRCFKAVAVIYDSLYVTAFYTPQVIPSGGPETWGGLPGMILGLAVPRLYTTWMAVSFEPTEIPVNIPKFPKRRKSQFNWVTYYTEISGRFSDWGNFHKTLMVWMWGM